MAKSPQDVAQKWQKNLAGSGESIRRGVMAVTEAPTARAARRADAYLAGVQKSVADGKWERGLLRVSLADWQRDMIDKGLARIAGGATAGLPKMQEFLTEFLPFQEAIVARVDQTTPRGDLEQNIQRATEVMRQTAQFQRSQ